MNYAASEEAMKRITTRERLAIDLAGCGLTRGDVVIVHSSLKSLGVVDGGADTVIDALLDVIGEEGTLCVPTIIHTSGIPREPFDMDTSPSEVGLITETLRTRPGAVRSNHPTHSVAAIGKRACELVAGHESAQGPWTPWGPAAFGKGSPWDKLREWDCVCVLLGVDFSVCTFFHYAQIRFVERHQPSHAQAVPWPNFDHRRMGGILRSELRLKPRMVGCAKTYVVRVRAIVDITMETLEKSPVKIMPRKMNPPFAVWARTAKNAMPLRCGVGRAAFDLPSWPLTKDGTSLAAKVLVAMNEEKTDRVAIAQLSLIGLYREDVLRVREAVAEATGVPPGNVFVSCSHVHSGPWTILRGKDAVIPSVVKAVSEAARRAAGNLRPSRVGWAKRNLEGVSHLRRLVFSDGKVRTLRRAVPSTWRFEDNPEFVRYDGALDTELIVMRFETLERNPFCCLFHFGCHPNPDFFGYAADRIEDMYGGALVCMPLKGASGDIDTPFFKAMNGCFSAEQLPQLGGTLAGAVLEMMARAEMADGGRVGAACREVVLPVSPWVSRNRSRDPIDKIRRVVRAGRIETEVQAVRIAGTLLVGFPGEIASSMGGEMKNWRPGSCVCPIDQSTDGIGYLMEKSSFKIGGYECDPRYWCLSTSAAAAILKKAASECMNLTLEKR